MNATSGKSVKQKLYDVIFKSDTPAGKLFDVALLILILLSVLTVMLESMASLQQKYRGLFLIAEWWYTILFTLELLLRIWVYPKRREYLFSFFGIVDFLAILPTYISLIVPGTQYLMVIRVLRLLRIARIFKLTHFLKEANMLSGALRASLPKILVFIGTVLTLVIVIGSVMYVVEGGKNGFTSIPKSIYWAIVTLTTVGYGDIAPKTPLGQMLAGIVMLLGYGIIAIPTGIVTVEIANINKGANQRICVSCGKGGHEPTASFCNACGTALPPNQ